jgi:hypothetical protein
VARLSLQQTFVLVTSSLNLFGNLGQLSFQLAQASGIGILVQRITGHHRLLGRLVPSLGTVGGVPFGKFTRGHHRVRWDLRVNWRRLPRGHYLVTPRLFTRGGIVRELGRPHILQIH